MDRRLHWVEPTSSAVRRYAYSPRAQCLYVEFRNGRAGFFSNVSEEDYLSFEAAPSKGGFIGRELRNKPAHPWTRLPVPL